VIRFGLAGGGPEAPQEPDWRAIGARERAAYSRSFHMQLGIPALCPGSARKDSSARLALANL
jgi:hypothetical protein